MIDDEKLIALDIETSNGKGKGSLEPRNQGSVIALVQLGYEDGTVEIHDWNSDTENLLQRLIDEGHRFVVHNASFELDWFAIKSNLRIPKVWCTMVASHILNAGKSEADEATLLSGRLETKNTDYLGVYNPIFIEQDENLELAKKKSSRFSHSYQAVVYRYANGAKVMKDQGNSDWLKRPLSPDQLRYAQDDVRYGITVARNQWKFLKKLGIDKVAELEMNILNAVADMKVSGIKVDIEKWKDAASEYGSKAEELSARLNHELGLEAAKNTGILSVFGTYVPKAFNVASPTQLARFFGTDNADESTLRSLEHPLISDILEFKEYDKISSTYGDSYLSFIWPHDSRIHSGLIQTETHTGRFSSRKPALQTIPPDMLKSLLTTDEGKILVFADYSSVESRILAYAANDANFINSVNSRDVHSENARKIFKIPPDSPVDPELRRKAKVLSFGIPYGASAVGLLNRGLAETIEESQDLLDEFFRQYPNVNKFLKNSAGEALSQGFTQDSFGRIRWYEMPKRLSSNVSIEAREEREEEIRKAAQAAARQAQNFKIQSSSANVTKQAIQDIHAYLGETGYGFMVLTIHDSIIFEFYLEHAAEATKAVKRLMEEAGPKIIPGIITPVDVDVGHKIKRTCVISGLKFSVFSHDFDGESITENLNFIEPRVKQLMEQNKVPNDFQTKSRLGEIVREKSDEWKASNKDLVAALR